MAVAESLLVAWLLLLLHEARLGRILLHGLLLAKLALRRKGHTRWLGLQSREVLLHCLHAINLRRRWLEAWLLLWEAGGLEWHGRLLARIAGLLSVHLLLRLIAGQLRL